MTKTSIPTVRRPAIPRRNFFPFPPTPSSPPDVIAAAGRGEDRDNLAEPSALTLRYYLDFDFDFDSAMAGIGAFGCPEMLRDVGGGRGG